MVKRPLFFYGWIIIGMASIGLAGIGLWIAAPRNAAKLRARL